MEQLGHYKCHFAEREKERERERSSEFLRKC